MCSFISWPQHYKRQDCFCVTYPGLLSNKWWHFGKCYKNSYMTHGGLCRTARYLLFLNEYTEAEAQQFVYHTYEMMHSSLYMRVQQQSSFCTSAFFVWLFILYLSWFFHLGVLLLMLAALSFKLPWPVLWESSPLSDESEGLGSLWHESRWSEPSDAPHGLSHPPPPLSPPPQSPQSLIFVLRIETKIHNQQLQLPITHIPPLILLKSIFHHFRSNF